MTRCAEMRSYDMLQTCVLAILNGLQTKKSKEVIISQNLILLLFLEDFQLVLSGVC